jgi:hypothetical protein
LIKEFGLSNIKRPSTAFKLDFFFTGCLAARLLPCFGATWLAAASANEIMFSSAKMLVFRAILANRFFSYSLGGAGTSSLLSLPSLLLGETFSIF